MSSTFILRQDRRGQLSLHRGAKCVEWKTDKFSAKAAEDEASRARFRDDGASYCVYVGMFHGLAEVNKFIELVNRGKGFEAAWKRVIGARKPT